MKDDTTDMHIHEHTENSFFKKLLLLLLIYPHLRTFLLLLEGQKGKQERDMDWVSSHACSCGGGNLQPGCVPRPGMGPASVQSAG